MKKEQISNFRSRVITFFIYAIFCIHPFYLENHHYNVGEAKSHFLYGLSIVVVIIILVWEIRFVFLHHKEYTIIKVKQLGKDISITEKFLVLYTLFIIVSYMFTEYKAETLWGIYNWRVGALPLVLVSVMTIFIIHLWKGDRFIIAATGGVSSIVFLLGVCNRFSVYPIMIKPMQKEFISTLGNINWFCGYLTVIAPIGIGMFIFGEYTDPTERWKKIYWGMYAALCFVTAFCQGSDSVYLWYASLFPMLLWIVAKKKEWMQDWLILFIMWALSAQFVRLVKFLAPGSFNYEAHKYLISSNFTLILAFIAILMYCLVFSGKFIQWEITGKTTCNIRGSIIAILIGIVLIWFAVSVCNTRIGISGLEENTLFLLNEKWGTDRGSIMAVSLKGWLNMPLMKKIFGCGPDGYYYYMYSIPEIADFLRKNFSDVSWTNAHCELLTSLINVGLAGTISYVGIFVSFVYRCMKKGKESPLLYIPALSVVCYLVHNLVSFAQVINYPYVFFIMGMGEYYLRKNKI